MRIKRRFTGENASRTKIWNSKPVRVRSETLMGRSHFNERVEVPTSWSQVATDIIAQISERRHPNADSPGSGRERAVLAMARKPMKRSSKICRATKEWKEHDSRQVFDRLAGCWTYRDGSTATSPMRVLRRTMMRCSTCCLVRWLRPTALNGSTRG